VQEVNIECRKQWPILLDKVFGLEKDLFNLHCFWQIKHKRL